MKNRCWIAWSLLCVCLTWAATAGEIHKYAEEGNAAKVRELLKADPALVRSLNGDYDTPLHLAAKKGHKEVVQVLLEYKADVNAQNANKLTPLKLAKGFVHRNVAELLVQRGAVDQVAPPRPAIVPRPQIPKQPTETPEEREARMEKLLGITVVPSGYEFVSTQYNCAIRLPAGWKKFSGIKKEMLVMATEKKEGKVVSLMVSDVAPEDRLDDRFMNSFKKGLLEKVADENKSKSAKTIKTTMGGLKAMQMNVDVSQPGGEEGTVTIRLVIADQRCYSLLCAMKDGDPAKDAAIKDALNSFRFLTPAQAPGVFMGYSAAELGYMTGYGLGAILLIAGIVALVRRLMKK